MKPKAIKVIEENIKKIFLPWLRKIFLESTPQAWFIKEKLINCTFSKLKTSLLKTVLRMKIQIAGSGKIFINHIYDKVLYKIYKELSKPKKKI